MPLTVLSQSSDDLIRLFHQSQLEWSRHVGEETITDFGRSILNPALVGSVAANCLLEASLPGDRGRGDFVDTLNSNGWLGCSLNPSAGDTAVGPIVQVLEQGGWRAADQQILVRRRRVELAGGPAVTVIPARASYRHFQELMQQRAVENLGPGVEESLLHLDDPHFEALLALEGREVVGSIGLLTSGEVGTIREWYVLPSSRGRGVGRLLLQRVLEICDRALLRWVMTGVGEERGRRILESAGFERVGEWRLWRNEVTRTSNVERPTSNVEVEGQSQRAAES